MSTQNDSPSGAATERVSAPATATTVSYAPRSLTLQEMEVERIGSQSSGMTIVFPNVRGGVCEFCGVIDGNYPSNYQYKLCPHYRGKQLACSYCPPTKNVDEVIDHSVIRVMQHPDHPKKLIVRCDSFDCKKKHEERWNISN